jgi:hypothetical protein
MLSCTIRSVPSPTRTITAGQTITADPQQCQLWICLDGAAAIGDHAIRPGEVWYLSATAEVKAVTACRFLRTFVPA